MYMYGYCCILTASDEKMGDLKVLFLEEEIKELKKALREERNTNQYLQQLLDTAQKQVSEHRLALT